MDDVRGILTLLARGLQYILGTKLIGVYLTGSLTYGDFDRGSSDIDFLVVLNDQLSSEEFERVRALHADIEQQYPAWAQRVEGSYITKDMLSEVFPPKAGRPYYNNGCFWESAPYGNEWLLNLYALRVCGVALAGPEPRELIPPIDIRLVREASLKDLYDEWVPQLDNPAGLHDSHVQAYAILTLCRILHRMRCDEIVSKREAAAWVRRTYCEPWVELIEKAEHWQHGQGMNALHETMAFIRFVLQQVNHV